MSARTRPTFRPWVVLGALGVAFVANVALVATEELPTGPGDRTSDRVSAVDQLVYAAVNRTRNLQVLGLDPPLVDETNQRMTALAPEEARLRLLLESQSAAAAAAFCRQDLPPPYAALGILVVQDNDLRTPIDIDRLVRLEPAPFYGAWVERLHERVELSDPPTPGGTALAVGAVLASREADALEARPPFGPGGPGLGALDPPIRRKLVTYFAMVHVLAEIARDPARGVCR